MKISEIKLGQKVKDLVTGLTGIAISHVTFMNGCHQLGVKPCKLNKDGETMGSEYIDIEQLEVIQGGIATKLKNVKTSGGIKAARDLPNK